MPTFAFLAKKTLSVVQVPIALFSPPPGDRCRPGTRSPARPRNPLAVPRNPLAGPGTRCRTQEPARRTKEPARRSAPAAARASRIKARARART